MLCGTTQTHHVILCLNKYSHLWLEVNRLQTSALKLHHCLESFIVISLQCRKHTAENESGSLNILSGA